MHISLEDQSLWQASDSHWSYPFSSQIGLWSPDSVSDPLSWDEMLCHHPFNRIESHSETAVFLLLSSPTVTNVWTHHGVFKLQTSRSFTWAKGHRKSGRDKAKGREKSGTTIERNVKRAVASVFLCFRPWWFIVDVFIALVPHKASLIISQNMYHSPRLKDMEGGDEKRWMDLRGAGPKKHAVYSMGAHCAAFRSCQK